MPTANRELSARAAATEKPGRRAARREHRVIMFGIELDAVAHLLRDRRLQERVITGVIGLVALAGLARETQERSLARLATWSGRYYFRDLRQART